MKWTDIWLKPFYYDGFGYIHSKNGVMTFTIDLNLDPESPFMLKLMADMVSVLNGNSVDEKYQHLEIKDGCDLYYNGQSLGSFRGWGHLTGTGSNALGLSEDDAVAVQDEMINYVVNKLQE